MSEEQEVLSKLRDYIARMPVPPPPPLEQIEAERREAALFGQFVHDRLVELGETPQQFAKHLDIEIEFVETVLEGTFPVRILSQDMLQEMAHILHCQVADLTSCLQSHR